MKHLIWIPVGLLLTAGAAALILTRVRGDYFLHEIGFALGITLISANVAMIPMMLTRKAGPVANFQAAFGGTVIHLFLTLGAGAACYALGPVGNRQIYLFLLLAFYWFSLMFVVVAMIKLFRRSIPQGPGAATGARPSGAAT